jgi:small subunit ribosomal protein S17
MSTKISQKNTGTEPLKKQGKCLQGVVVSNKMIDTIVVEVTRYVKHPKYGKFQKIAKKYKAHDAGNTAQIGDKVKITEGRPISKDKRFRLISIEK